METFSSKPINLENKPKALQPLVIRNIRGQVVWQMPGNTQEQDEQLGIRQIQGLFREAFPEFDELFPRGEDNQITRAQRDSVITYILDKIGKKDAFEAVMGSTSLIRARNPYFEGSHIIALQKSFSPWGLEIPDPSKSGDSSIPKDRRGTVIWSKPGNTPEQNEQIGIRNIQELFLKAFPEFNNLFPRNEEGKISEASSAIAQKFIIDAIGRQASFTRFLGGTALHQAYFDSHWVALQKSFAPWGLEIPDRSNPESLVERDSRGYVKCSLPGKSLSENEAFGISQIQALFLEAFPEFRATFPLGEDGKIQPDKRDEARAFILKYLGTKREAEKIISDGFYNAQRIPWFQGTHFIILQKSFAPWGIEFTYPLEGPLITRGARGRLVWSKSKNTYEENERLGIENIQGGFLALYPEFNDLFPRDINGQIEQHLRDAARDFIIARIGSYGKIREIFTISPLHKQSAPYFEGSYSILLQKSFAQWGIHFTFDTSAYSDLITREKYGRVSWSKVGNTPEQDEKLGIANIQGLFLLTFPDFSQLFPLGDDGKVLEEFREEAEIFIFERLGKQDDLKRIEAASANIADIAPYFKGLYAIVVYKSFKPWGINFEIRKGERGIRTILVSPAYERRKRSEKIKEIDAIVENLLERGISLDTNSLIENGLPRLEHQILAYYPNGFSGLREKYPNLVRKERGKWKGEEGQERIRQEVIDFYNQYGRISKKVFLEHGKGYLDAAIIENYPGGYPQLRRDLGLKVIKNETGYWTEERVIAEAKEFYLQEGDITVALLRARGRKPLASQVMRFPGGVGKLRDIICAESRRKDNYWTEESVEQEARAFYQEYGGLSHALLVKYGRQDLLGAIGKHYLGKLTALKDKIIGKQEAQNPEDNFWDEYYKFLEDYDGYISPEDFKELRGEENE